MVSAGINTFSPEGKTPRTAPGSQCHASDYRGDNPAHRSHVYRRIISLTSQPAVRLSFAFLALLWSWSSAPLLLGYRLLLETGTSP